MVKQLALELDTYMNEFDPDSNHIAIDTTSIINPIAIETLNTIGVDLKSGRDIRVRMDYDGCKIQVSVAYSGNPLVGVLNHSIRMSDTVPSHVYVGFSGSTGPYPELHQVVDWTFTSMSLPSGSLHCRLQKDDDLKTKMVIAISIAMALFIVTFCVWRALIIKKVNVKRKGVDDIESRSLNAANIPKMFTYKELLKATNNFNRDNLLGVGGFGSVYKGVIASDPPSIVAVKKMSATSKQGTQVPRYQIVSTD